MIHYLKLLFLPFEQNNYRPRILEKRYFFIVVLFLIGIKLLSIISFERFLGADIFNSVSQSDLYMLTNQARKDNQLLALNQNAKLELAAQLKLNDMLQNNYFAHVSPLGATPWVWIGKANYDYVVAGENLAMNFYNSDQTIKAWLNSELHRKNILLPEFQDIGIAVGPGNINGQNTTVVVQVFGKPKIQIATVQAASIQEKIVQQKPIVTPMSKPSATQTPKVTSQKTIKPKTLSISTPRPTFIPTTFITPLAKSTPMPIQIAQVKSEMNFVEGNMSGMNAYSYNLFIEKFMVILTAIMLVIFMLKIFVKINIQFPELIFRAGVLIVLAALFANLQDSQILSYISGNVILP